MHCEEREDIACRLLISSRGLLVASLDDHNIGVTLLVIYRYLTLRLSPDRRDLDRIQVT